jgi:hypothetical protein
MKKAVAVWSSLNEAQHYHGKSLDIARLSPPATPATEGHLYRKHRNFKLITELSDLSQHVDKPLFL